ncbi:FecR domain-containing protein [Novosphingobium sediminicola]|uniref:Transmembrane sensor n=1 Tax=Novosphingobium sediminicola TaxID=563162 RepID=A0A7W6CIQ8_9SPHN|nr:transmembrane sensor [Novosphingobium sediminicola]
MAQRAQFEAWLDEHPRHSGALLRAQAVLHLATAAAPAAQETSPLRRWRLAAGALGLLAASLVAWLAIDPGAQTYATTQGELRRLALADGSALTLDAASKLRVDLDEDTRKVSLSQGRALFRVAHNAARPFSVQAGDVTITDIGTVFSVSTQGDTVNVLVSEGEVEVRRGGVLLRLTAGQGVRLGKDGAPVRMGLAAPALERALAWTSGRIDLDGETLASALAEFNQHNRVSIRLANPALGREKFYGAFRLDDPEGFARAAALGLNVQMRAEEGGWVIGAK